jgi:hypothetical protein
MARPRAPSLKYSRKMALPIARGMRASALHEPDLRGFVTTERRAIAVFREGVELDEK